MATTPAPSPRASLLAGLRTGGVRSASGPMGNAPHTAAPGGSFNVPRFLTPSHDNGLYQQEEEEDELANMMQQNLYIKNNVGRLQQQMPMTAAVDGANNRFSQHQSMGGNGYNNFNVNVSTQNQLQAVQLQMMQMEITRLQNLQAQQYQAEILAQAQAIQAQRQRQASQPVRRGALGFAPPATAGPLNSTFDMRASANAPPFRSNQAEQLRAKLGVVSDEQQYPMTAALGGKFGSRLPSTGRYSDSSDPEDEFSSTAASVKPPSTPSYTTVISGGTSLGSPASNNINGQPNSPAPSKSDAAVSWRRGTTNNSVLNGANRAVTSPLVTVTPPPPERSSPPPLSALRTRPQPLRFSAAVSQPLASTVAVDGAIANDDADDCSSTSSKSNSSPSTPHTASSSDIPLSPREEAAKKLYEGLGIGRPNPTISVTVPEGQVMVVKSVSHPVRQPRGPPSNTEELVPKNFATRSRRKAIGALGALMDARERREVIGDTVEVY